MGEPIQLAPWMCHNCGYWVGEGLTAIPSSCGRCGKSRGPFTHEDNPYPHPTVAAPPVVVPVDAPSDWKKAANIPDADATEAESIFACDLVRRYNALRSRLTAVEQALAIQAEISVKLSAHATAVEQERDEWKRIATEVVGEIEDMPAAARSSSDQEGR